MVNVLTTQPPLKNGVFLEFRCACTRNLRKFQATTAALAKSDSNHRLLCFINSSVSSGQNVVLFPW